MKRIHITTAQLQDIADALADNLLRTGTPGEATIGDVTLTFGGRVSVHSETVLTGVELLGEKESYLKDIVTVSDLHLNGAYDEDGQVATDLDVRRIPLACDCDTHRISVSCRKAVPDGDAVRRPRFNLRRPQQK